MILQITVCLVIDTALPSSSSSSLNCFVWGLAQWGPPSPRSLSTGSVLCKYSHWHQLQLLCSMTHFPHKVGSAQDPTGPFPQNLGSASEWDRVPGCKEAGQKTAVPRLQKGSLRAWTLRRQRHSTSRADLPNFYVLRQKEAFFRHVVSDFQTVPNLNRFLKA